MRARAEGTSQLYRLAWGFYLLLAVAGALWMGGQDGSIRLERFLARSRWPQDAAIGLAAAGLLLLLWDGGRRVVPAAQRLEERLAELIGPAEPAEVVALALLSGFAEETFFRGAVQGAWGWLPATLLFALAHPGPERGYGVWTIFVGVAGLGLAGLVEWRGNLLAAIVAHVVINGVNLTRLARRAAAAAAKAPSGESD